MPPTRHRGRGRCSRPSCASRADRDRRLPRGGRARGLRLRLRYVDAWHVMNVAIAPEFRRRGIATTLLERLFEVTEADPRRGYTLEVRVSNTDAIRLYERLGFEARGIRWLLHRQSRRRAHHVARAGHGGEGLRSSRCGAALRPRGRSRAVPGGSPGECEWPLPLKEGGSWGTPFPPRGPRGRVIMRREPPRRRTRRSEAGRDLLGGVGPVAEPRAPPRGTS